MVSASATRGGGHRLPRRLELNKTTSDLCGRNSKVAMSLFQAAEESLAEDGADEDYAHVNNAASNRSLEKAGFRLEGCLRKNGTFARHFAMRACGR